MRVRDGQVGEERDVEKVRSSLSLQISPALRAYPSLCKPPARRVSPAPLPGARLTVLTARLCYLTRAALEKVLSGALLVV